MKKPFEFSRDYPKTTAAIGIGIIAGTLVGGLLVEGYADNPSEPMPDGACESPITQLPGASYQDPDSNWFKLYTGTGEGIVVQGELPTGAYGVRAAWKPSFGDQAWTQSDVVPVNPTTHTYRIKLAMGDGPAVFGVSTVAKNAGTPEAIDACRQGPEVYANVLRQGFGATEGDMPWPQPLNILGHVVAKTF